MIGVFGESLVDLVTRGDDHYQAVAGGSPLNVALALGRQGIPVRYLSPLSEDRLGGFLRDALRRAGVSVDTPRSRRASSLAVVSVDATGQPRYSLYRQDVADRDCVAAGIARHLPDGMPLLHTGSLALVPEDLPRAREIMRLAKARGALVSVDPNLRGGAVDNLGRYVDGVRSLWPLCDVLKVSDEDLDTLGIHGDPDARMDQLLDAMPDGLIALTLGSRGALIGNSAARARREAWPVDTVRDTVGAGDCFQAGLLAALWHAGLLRTKAARLASAETLRRALDWACASAAWSVMRDGCAPPTRDELRSFVGDPPRRPERRDANATPSAERGAGQRSHGTGSEPLDPKTDGQQSEEARAGAWRRPSQ